MLDLPQLGRQNSPWSLWVLMGTETTSGHAALPTYPITHQAAGSEKPCGTLALRSCKCSATWAARLKTQGAGVPTQTGPLGGIWGRLTDYHVPTLEFEDKAMSIKPLSASKCSLLGEAPWDGELVTGLWQGLNA